MVETRVVKLDWATILRALAPRISEVRSGSPVPVVQGEAAQGVDVAKTFRGFDPESQFSVISALWENAVPEVRDRITSDLLSRNGELASENAELVVLETK